MPCGSARGRRAVVLALAAALALGVAAAITTWWALEASGVAILETRRADGTARSTHVWHTVNRGELWLEAGAPENGWFQDVGHSPHLVLSIDGRSAEYRAEPLPNPAGHREIRARLREKYGLRDWWVGLLVDTSHSVAVKLHPVP